jgi:uncharacterized protein YhaN
VRIRELYLKAFGPFTETRIQFPDLDPATGLGPGLCVVYGPNEIGKTSALRAIRDLFYGIPPQSPDKFIHSYPQMRVGAQVVFADGEVFGFLRRKGSKDTLLEYAVASGGANPSAAETPAANARFDALIQAVPVKVFENFYGLDHADLSRGSHELLENEGELGQALFSAGLGGANLRAVLEGLASEAEDLFKPRGSSPRINASLRELEEIKKEIKANALTPTVWKEATDASLVIESELERLEVEIERTQSQRTRLDRIRRTLPALGRYRRARDEFSTLEGVREVAADFEERLLDTRAKAVTANERRERMAESIERLEARRAELRLVPDLVAARASIESLAERIGAYQDEVDQLPRRETEVARLDQEIRAILDSIGVADSPTALDVFRAPMSRAARIRELAGEVIEHETRLEAATERLETAKAIHARLEAELEGLDEGSEPMKLRQSLERARRLGEIDDRLATEGPALEAAEEECDRALQSLSRWPGPLDAIDRIAFPETETIESFAARFEELRRRHERLADAMERLAAERREVDEQLSQLRSEGSVPSESERDAQRVARDRTWREIRATWIGGGTEGRARSPEGTAGERNGALAERFESEVGLADDVADRLRNEAGRVAQQAQLLSKLDRIEADADACALQRDELGETQKRVDREWNVLWTRLEILHGTPVEMRGWLERLRRLRESVLANRRQRREWNALRVERDEARDRIGRELASLGVVSPTAEDGGRLDGVVSSGDEVARRLESELIRTARLREDRDAAAQVVERAEATHRKAVEGRRAVGLELSESVVGLGLAENPRPRDVQDRLETLAQLFERSRDREKLVERVEKMRINVDRFAAVVGDLVARCTPELRDAQPDTAVIRLRELLAEAAHQETLRVEIDGSLEDARVEVEASKRALATAMQEMDGFRQEVGVENDAELEEALVTSKARARARGDLENQEAQLAELGEGRSISELEAEAKEVDADSLPGRIERLDNQLQEWRAAQADAFTQRGIRREELARMDGSEQVSRLAEEAQARVASVGADLRRYVELILAREILAREIELYRQRNQAPVLGRTSELLSALTRGAYRGVQSEYDAADRPQLIAIGADGDKKGVPALSSGTRDQLFLALRLATLEETLDRAEPMPLIADDILVEFDEERSRAALEVLADLGRKTQILLFSHHAHVAEQARELGGRAHVIDL